MESAEPIEYHVYCDESGLHGDRYRVYGGIVLLSDSVVSVEAMADRWRKRTCIHSELAWNSISNRTVESYRSFIDEIFEATRNVRIAYKSMVVDTHDPDFVELTKKNPETAFYKLYYQFLLHKFAEYAAKTQHRSLRVFIDDRETKYDLSDLKVRLNAGSPPTGSEP
jgi:hypothetical protein